MNRYFYPGISLAVLLAATGLFFFRIGHSSLWSDELVSAEIAAHDSQAEIWAARHPNLDNRTTLGCMAPYYSALRIWTGAWGASEKALRSLSAFCALLALGMILVLGPRHWRLGKRTALVAGSLLVLSPMMLWYAQEARYYAFLQPLSLMACWFYLRFWETLSRRWFAAWTACAIFSVLAHSYMIFLIAGLCVYGLWQWYRQRFPLKGWVITGHLLVAGVFLIMLQPLLATSGRDAAYDLIAARRNIAYELPTDEFMLWKVLANFLCGPYEHPSAILATVILAVATVAWVVHLERAVRDAGPLMDRRSSATIGFPDQETVLWILASLGVCILMITVSWFRPFMVDGKRYVMVFFAPFCVAMGRALAAPPFPRITAVVFLGMVALNALLTDGLYFTEPQRQNWRLAGRIIREVCQDGDAWLHQNPPRAFAHEYYGRGNRSIRDVVMEIPALEQPLPAELRDARRVWMVKTGAIADSYRMRLEEAGFRLVLEQKLPSGTHFMTILWLFERSPPPPP